MLASSDFGFRRAHTKGQSAVARVPKWVWVLSAVATGTLLLASHSARAQETESTTGTTPTPTPAITLSVNPTSVTESSSPIAVTVTATVEEAVSSDVTVSVSVGKKGDSAIEGPEPRFFLAILTFDYNVVRDLDITIGVGRTSGTGTFNLSGTDDELIGEGTESITVSGTATGYTVDGTSIPIADADTAVRLSVSPGRAAESSSDISVTVTATVSVALSSDVVIKVSVGKSGDSAVEGTDYDEISDYNMTLEAGDTSVSTDFILSSTEDNIAAEGSEFITISGSNSNSDLHFNDNLYFRITDTDALPSSFSFDVDADSIRPGSQTNVEEADGAVTFTVTASFPDYSHVFSSDRVVNITVGKVGDSAGGGGSDYSGSSFSITIEAGSTQGTTNFTLNVIDDNYAGEGEETLTLSASIKLLSSNYSDSVSITIKDNDEPPTTINLSVTGNGVENATKPITVSASFPIGSTVLPSNTTVSLSFSSGSATSGVDYELPSSSSVTIGPGRTSGTLTFDLVALEDSIAEGGETINISGVSVGFDPISSLQITILDNDITLVLDTDANRNGNQSVIYEGSSAIVKISAKFPGSSTLSSSTQVSINVGKNGDSAIKGFTRYYDYTVSGSTVTIPAGTSEGFSNFTFSLRNDTVRERPEYVTISASASGFIIEDEVRLTIQDNDIDLTVTPGSIKEFADDMEFEVTATLPYVQAPTGGLKLIISVGKSSDSATSGVDYLAVDDFILKIPHMSSVGRETFKFTIVEDDIGDSLERVTVHGRLKDFDTSTIKYTASGDSFEIQDFTQKFPLTLTFLQGGTRIDTVAEDVSGSLWLEVGTGGLRQSFRSIPISFYGTATSNQDYTGPMRVPTMNIYIASSIATTSTTRITLDDDDIAEGPETIYARSILGDVYYKSNVVTITDNDVAPTIINLSVDRAMVTESASPQTVRVTASFPANSDKLPRDVVVEVGVGGNGGVGNADSKDFTEVKKFTVIIPKCETSGWAEFILVGTNDNVAGEGMETVTVSGSAAGFMVTGTTFKINDGDAPPTNIILTVDTDNMTTGNQTTVTEDSGETTVKVTASFPTGSATLATNTTVEITVAGGTATIGTANDFTLQTDKVDNKFDIVIEARKMSHDGTFKITVVNDRIYDQPATNSNETVTVSGSSADKVTVSGSLTPFVFTNSSVGIADNEIADLNSNDCNGTYVDSTKALLVADCKVLIAIRNAWSPNLSDAHPLRTWGNTDNRDIDDWSGITISSQQVTKLLLPGNSANGLLGGSLPIAIGNLSKLVEIDLSGNSISNNGSVNIPNQFGQLLLLEKLDLSNNNLSGSLSGRWWSNLSKLTTLDLSHNKLSDMIPGRLRNLSALTDLDLSDNDFSGNIPTRLNSLTSLKTLDVSNNALSGTIASRLGDLATSGSLTKFSFCGNDLTGSLPTAFHTGVSTPGIASSDYNNIAVCRRSSQ